MKSAVPSQPDAATGDAAPAVDRTRRPPLLPGRRLRNVSARFRDTLGFFTRLHRDYGGIVRYRMLGAEFCILSDPLLIEELLYDKRTSFEKGFMYKRILLFDRPTTVTGDGESHRRTRRIVQPYLHPKMLATYSDIMAERAAAMREQWRDGQTIDLDEASRELMLGISLAIFFGGTMKVDAELAKNAMKLGIIDAGLTVLPVRWLRWVLLWSFRRLQREYARLGAEVLAQVASARASEDPRPDLVAFLARARDEDGQFAFDEKGVLDNAVEMLVASFRTTAAAMAWSVFFLARNPDARDRVEREVDEALDGRRPTLEDYDRLPYTGAVIKEAMRLAPPAYYVGRRALRDCTIGGYFIPAGSNVQVFVCPAQLDARYFPDPDRFRPERWLEPRPEMPKCAYMPFGAGTRDCAGANFASLNLAFALASIAQRWRLDPTFEGMPRLDTRAAYLVRDGGLPVRVTARPGRSG